jgi:hypothetical protein
MIAEDAGVFRHLEVTREAPDGGAPGHCESINVMELFGPTVIDDVRFTGFAGRAISLQSKYASQITNVQLGLPDSGCGPGVDVYGSSVGSVRVDQVTFNGGGISFDSETFALSNSTFNEGAGLGISLGLPNDPSGFDIENNTFRGASSSALFLTRNSRSFVFQGNHFGPDAGLALEIETFDDGGIAPVSLAATDCAHANTFCASLDAVKVTTRGVVGNGLSGTLLDLSHAAWTIDPPQVSMSGQIFSYSFGAANVTVTPTCGVVDAGC